MSDGTVSGSKMIVDIVPGSTGSDVNGGNMAHLGDMLLFIADDGIVGDELWGYNIQYLDSGLDIVTEITYS